MRSDTLVWGQFFLLNKIIEGWGRTIRVWYGSSMEDSQTDETVVARFVIEPIPFEARDRCFADGTFGRMARKKKREELQKAGRSRGIQCHSSSKEYR